MPDEPQEFVIDRSKWRCGGEGPFRHGRGFTQLLNNQYYSDVIGMTALQLGCKPEELRGRPFLAEKDKSSGVESLEDRDTLIVNKWGYISAAARDLVLINDHEGLSDGEREERLLSKFKDAGAKLTFTGQYQPPDRPAEQAKGTS